MGEDGTSRHQPPSSSTESQLFRAPLLEPPVDHNAANTEVGNVVKDGRRHIDGTAGARGALVDNLGSRGLSVGRDGDPPATDGGVVGVGVVAVLRRGESHDGVSVIVSPAAGTESLERGERGEMSVAQVSSPLVVSGRTYGVVPGHVTAVGDGRGGSNGHGAEDLDKRRHFGSVGGLQRRCKCCLKGAGESGLLDLASWRGSCPPFILRSSPHSEVAAEHTRRTKLCINSSCPGELQGSICEVALNLTGCSILMRCANSSGEESPSFEVLGCPPHVCATWYPTRTPPRPSPVSRDA